jgi:HEAT repeat protein
LVGAIVQTVGRFSKIAGKAGVGLPGDDRRTAGDALDGLLELSRSEESRARQLACKNLCTCHVRADDGRVWARLLELVEDPDPLVRRDVIHALTDSTPSLRVPAVIQALESRRNDPDERIRRRVRKTLAHYRRTGKVTDAAR